MKYRELHFEDKGQDFLTWVINEENVVVDSQPFQSQMWCGKKLMANIEVGQAPMLICDGQPFQLNYAITEIKEPKEEYKFWQFPDSNEKRMAVRGQKVS